MYAQYALTGVGPVPERPAYPFGTSQSSTAKLSRTSLGKYYAGFVRRPRNVLARAKNAIADLAAVQPVSVAIMMASNSGWTPRCARVSTVWDNRSLSRRQHQLLATNRKSAQRTTTGRCLRNHLAVQRGQHRRATTTPWPSTLEGANPYDNVWAPDAIQPRASAWVAEAMQGMKTMLQKYQNYPNGMTNNTNGVFEYLGVHLSVMNESLLRPTTAESRLSALPADSASSTASRWPPRRHRVSSEKEGADIKSSGVEELAWPIRSPSA